jgi:hypothetical protein
MGLRPFGFRVLIVDPPDDIEHGSVLLPHGVHPGLTRGIVEALPPENPGCPYPDGLEPGQVVYYDPDGAVRIGEQKIVDARAIIAFDE